MAAADAPWGRQGSSRVGASRLLHALDGAEHQVCVFVAEFQVGMWALRHSLRVAKINIKLGIF